MPPISILPTLSKVLEKVIELQLRNYVTKYSLLPEIQSGFCLFYSCETALLNITDDIRKASDTKRATILGLIVYSKAFDIIDRAILLTILKFIGLKDNIIIYFDIIYLEEHKGQKLQLIC